MAGPGDAPALSPGVVTVLHLDLGARLEPASAYGLLDADERRRAAAMVFDRDRRRLVIAHALTRMALGWLSGADPARLAFSFGRHGKPRTDAPVQFNLSRSGDRACLAIATDRVVGVDLERDRDVDVGRLAATVASAAERAAIGALPVDQRLPAFFRLWTRKESLVKAMGCGLSVALDRITVSIDDGPGWLPIAGTLPGMERWQMVGLDTGGGYTSALTAEGAGWRVDAWHVSAADSHNALEWRRTAGGVNASTTRAGFSSADAPERSRRRAAPRARSCPSSGVPEASR
jgi:4'-phosphopantetheinyl transferase